MPYEAKTQTPTGYSRARIEQLAKPKVSKLEYLTGFNERQLVWGDKDSMWVLSPAALKARCGDRTKRLAKPKLDFKDHTNEVHLYTFSCGRASPLQKLFNQNQNKTYKNSDRINQLARPKTLPSIAGKLWTFSCGRESPIWSAIPKDKDGHKVSCNRPSSSDMRMALPKMPHKDFAPNMELRQDGRLSEKFLMKLKAKGDGVCTERLMQLSEPKRSRRKEMDYIDSRHPEKEIRPVHPTTRAYEATDNIQNLAKPKMCTSRYVPDRFKWPVSRAALKFKANENTNRLATPVIRPSMEHTQYDADAFRVKTSALKAVCGPRLEELATPVHR